MAFIACGLNHKTAPIEVREKTAFASRTHANLLLDITAQPAIQEALILSTCNRTEFYCATETPDSVVSWLAQQQTLTFADLEKHLYCYQDEDALRHTMRVACGLDSMMLGETQILGQMKQAYSQACAVGTIGSQLHAVFQHVLSVSKHIRTHTGIGINPISVAFAAVTLLKQQAIALNQATVLLIGAGETSQLVAKYLHNEGVKQFFIANRTRQHVDALSELLPAQVISIANIPEYLPKADIVISATACPWPFIGKGMIERAIKIRSNRPLFLLDLAVPRDIEPEVGELASVFLYNIDSLQALVTQGLNERREAAIQAEQIINYEVENFIAQQRGLKANDAICKYREKMVALGEQETKRALRSLQRGQSPELVIQALAQRLVNKLSHQPTVRLREASRLGQEEVLTAVEQLFSNTDF